MADGRELGPESPRLSVSAEPDETHTPDCTSCERFGSLLVYLETGEGPFTIAREEQDRLRKRLSRTPDSGGMATVMFNAGVCPFSMLERESPEVVMLRVSPESCFQFDGVYRPGIDQNAE